MAEIIDDVQKLIARDAELATLISDLEKSAVTHEQLGKEFRAQRDEAKLERQQIRKTLDNARVVVATQGAEAAAKQSQAEAEKLRIEAVSVLEALKARDEEAKVQQARMDALEKSLTEKSAKMDEQLAKAETPTNPQ